MDDSVGGMTVNERLFHFGLIESFDLAAKSGNFDALVHLLVQAKLSEEQAEQTARGLLDDPKRYGY
jgi:hypothetical protein